MHSAKHGPVDVRTVLTQIEIDAGGQGARRRVQVQHGGGGPRERLRARPAELHDEVRRVVRARVAQQQVGRFCHHVGPARLVHVHFRVVRKTLRSRGDGEHVAITEHGSGVLARAAVPADERPERQLRAAHHGRQVYASWGRRHWLFLCDVEGTRPRNRRGSL